jgi:hypothetical protein
MFRKALIALSATAVLTAASLTPASAHGWHGWGWGAAAFGAGILGATIAATAAQPVNCWQYQYVVTPSGYYKRILVNVCAQ